MVVSVQKNFPKQWQDETIVTESSYPLYMRRSPKNGGRTHTMRVCGSEISVDNSFVVPYNPILCAISCTHKCGSCAFGSSCKVSSQIHNQSSRSCSYGNSSRKREWWNFKIRQCSLHLRKWGILKTVWIWNPQQRPICWKVVVPFTRSTNHTVLFQPEEIPQFLAQGPPDTKLTVIFTKMQKIRQRGLSSIQMFHIFLTWNKKEYKWQRQKRGLRNPENPDECRTDCIGPIPTISLSPHQAELYYFRLLLHHKPSATSFEDLKTVNVTICTSFQDACDRLGLLDNHTKKDAVMQEHRLSDSVQNYDKPSQLSSSIAVQLILSDSAQV